MKRIYYLLLSIVILIGGIICSSLIHTPKKSSGIHKLSQDIHYAFKHKKSNTLYPLIANQSAAYTEFYRLDDIEIRSTNNHIYITLTDNLKEDYVIYDCYKDCIIPITSSLQTTDIYCENHTLIITTNESSIDSE